MSDERIRLELWQYGGEILKSDQFELAMGQKHHRVTSVGEHTLRVAASSLRVCHVLERMHVGTDTRCIVQGALCHDLGILGRDEKYRNKRECYRKHPGDSVAVARELIPDIDAKTEHIIGRHMWPLGGRRPQTREEVIVSVADKYASVKDILSGAVGHLHRSAV